jgi:hypothetical protein
MCIDMVSLLDSRATAILRTCLLPGAVAKSDGAIFYAREVGSRITSKAPEPRNHKSAMLPLLARLCSRKPPNASPNPRKYSTHPRTRCRRRSSGPWQIVLGHPPPVPQAQGVKGLHGQHRRIKIIPSQKPNQSPTLHVQVSTTLLSLGRMGIKPSGDLLSLMTQHAILSADKYTPRAISSVLWAHVTLKLPEDPRVWDALLGSARAWIMSDQVRQQYKRVRIHKRTSSLSHFPSLSLSLPLSLSPSPSLSSSLSLSLSPTLSLSPSPSRSLPLSLSLPLFPA